LKVAHFVKLRWLIGYLDQLDFEEFDRVSKVLNKTHRDPNILDNQDLEIIDNVYFKLRNQEEIKDF
jgi:hypothetical protein